MHSQPGTRASGSTSPSIVLGQLPKETSMPKAPRSAHAATKQETIITLLKRPKGASIDELMKATGWQRHSVHGTLSGVLKKRLGLNVKAEATAKGHTYRIVSPQS